MTQIRLFHFPGACSRVTLGVLEHDISGLDVVVAHSARVKALPLV